MIAWIDANNHLNLQAETELEQDSVMEWMLDLESGLPKIRVIPEGADLEAFNEREQH